MIHIERWKKMKKVIALALALMMLLVLLAACAGPTATTPTPGAPTGPQGGDTTTGPTEPSPEEWDPANLVEIVANFDNISLSGMDPHFSPTPNIVHFLMSYNALMRICEYTLRPEPDLAESVEVSDDGLTYTFTLRQGVPFHNGFGTMTAEDVVFSILRSGTELAQPAWQVNFERIYSVEALDTYTVQIVLNFLYPDFLLTMANQTGGSMIISKAGWEAIGDEGILEMSIGTGPFTFSEEDWIPQQQSRFVAFEHFFRGPRPVNVTITEIRDGSTALLAFQTGQIDFMLSSQREIVEQAEAFGANIDFMAAPIFFGLFLNGDYYEPFQNPRVRDAIWHAINRDANRLAVFGEHMARPATGIMTEVLEGATIEGQRQIEFNPELARQILREEGYEDALEFTSIIQNNVRNERIFTLIQANLADVGVTMHILPVSNTEYFATIWERRTAMSYVSVTGMPSKYLILRGNYYTGQAFNATDYSGVDELIDLAGQLMDGPERNEIYRQIQVQLSYDIPLFPHHFVNVIMVTRPGLYGIYSTGANGADIRFDKAFVG